MEMVNLEAIVEFGKKHADARKPLVKWVKVTSGANWGSLVDIKQSFNSVDYKNGIYIFNIKGNDYRLLFKVIFPVQTVYVVHVLTHRDYDELKL